MPDGNNCSLPKGVKAVRKRLSDGTLATYHYWRPNNAPVAGLPGTPEFLASLEVARTAPRRQRRVDYDARTYSNRLIDFADRAVKMAAVRAKARRLEFDLTAEYVRINADYTT